MENQIDPASQAPSAPPPPGSPQPEGSANPFTRLFGVLISPGETFEGIAKRPDWLVPLLIWIAISIASTMVLVPRLDYEPMFRGMLERNSRLTEKQRDQQLEKLMEDAENNRAWASYAPAIVVPSLMFLVVGSIMWGSLRAFGAENTFKQSFSVTIYAFTPQLVKAIIGTAIATTRTTIDARMANAVLKSNLGAFTSPTESPVIYALLSSVDLFTIWTIVLLSIGFAVVTSFRATKIAMLVVVLYLVVVLFKVGMAMLMGGFS